VAGIGSSPLLSSSIHVGPAGDWEAIGRPGPALGSLSLPDSSDRRHPSRMIRATLDGVPRTILRSNHTKDEPWHRSKRGWQ
jgi:hypothetical protein